MHCLWITRQDPRAANSGDLIYSLGLITALAQSDDIQLSVLTHSGLPTEQEIPGIRWELAGEIPAKNPLSLLSQLPSDAHRLGNPKIRETLAQLLKREHFDWFVIDQAASAWALSLLPEGARIAYVAHNYEAMVRPEIASENDGSLPFRLALKRDAALYASLERRLCAAAELITAITPRDEAHFRREFPGKSMLVLPPGFDGPIPKSDPTPITPDTPRRVVLAGTFEWIAKKRNLLAFLESAAEYFPAAKIDFQIVGKADPNEFATLAKRFPWASFQANVPSMDPHLREARIGLIPEALGGGFKLKALDYIFRGLPLASVEPALSGLPLEPGVDAITADTPSELARIVIEKIDDLNFLNHAAKSALANCRDAFHWRDRGKTLCRALQQPR